MVVGEGRGVFPGGFPSAGAGEGSVWSGSFDSARPCEAILMAEDVGSVHGEFEVENLEELALDASDVALAEEASADRPVRVFER